MQMLYELAQALASLELHLSNVEKLATAWNEEASTDGDNAVRHAEEDLGTALGNAARQGRRYGSRLADAIAEAAHLRDLRKP